MAVAVLAVADTVEFELCLMVGNRGIFCASDSVAFLINHVEQANGVAGRLKGIEVSPVL